jgi:formylglycine-generating enzyme required for sulfatase activity
MASLAIGVAVAPAGEDARAASVRIPGTTVSLDLVRTPPGEVRVGEVTVGVGALWVGRTEVTWDLYDIYLYGLDKPDPDAEDADGISRPTKPYVPPDRGLGHAGYPALGMTRRAAEQFCVWLSEKTGERYRLPTEAEWVYLARGGVDEAARGAVSEASLDALVWHAGNTDWAPRPVGTKEANAFGLHDMLGNIAEWVVSEEKTPFAMGGSYLDELEMCTPGSKRHQRPAWQASDPQIPKSQWWLADCGFVGFRVVRDAGEPGDEAGE